MGKVVKVCIRMYTAGTGDCFALKFKDENDKDQFKMLVDAGTWSGKTAHLRKYANSIIDFFEGEVDVVVATHEHKDHVYLFNVCGSEFKERLNVKEVWLAWTEDESDELAREWKVLYGQKKRALANAVNQCKMALQKEDGLHEPEDIGFASRKSAFEAFIDSVEEFRNLHSFDAKGRQYKGGLKGMEFIKTNLNARIRYFNPGQIMTCNQLEGVNFNILGPPRKYSAVSLDHGRSEGDTFSHNNDLRRSEAFSVALDGNHSIEAGLFDSTYDLLGEEAGDYYSNMETSWRKIDFDWLISGAGNLALRLNSSINNLSLVMAIEFEATGKVMLFPGDAEFGSWESWHEIDWGKLGVNGKHFTEDLLNRVAFYKVAHHLSHNGTAKAKGLDMMIAKDLVSMATFDEDVISSGWLSTMPNKELLRELIRKTKGRLILMNESNVYCDFDNKKLLSDELKKAREALSDAEKEEFGNSFVVKDLYKEFSFRV